MIVKIFVQVLCMHLVVIGLNLQGSQAKQSKQRTMRQTVLHDLLLTRKTTTQREMPQTALHDVLLTGKTTTQQAKPQTVLHDVFLTRRITTRRTIRRPTTTIPFNKLRNSSQNFPPHGPVEADVSRGRINSPRERKAELSITTTPTLQEAAMNLSMLGPFYNITYHGRYDHHQFYNEYYRHVLYEHCARRIGWKKCLKSLAPGELSLCNMIKANKTYNGSMTIEKYPYIFEYFDYYNLDIQDMFCEEYYTGVPMAAIIVMYVICSLGLLGNGLSIITIYTADNQLTSTSIYLIALAISDSVYLLYNIAIFEQRNIYMREIGYDVVSSISAWLLVVITVERFLSIYNPYKVQDLCYPRSAKMFIAIVLFILSAIHTTMYLLYVYENSYDDSWLPHEEWIDATQKLTVMLFVLICGAPFLLILTLNFAIIRILYKAAKHRQKMSKSDWDKEKQITRTLVIVTTAYIVCIGPYHIIQMIFAFTDQVYLFDRENGILLDLTQEYMDILKIVNYCINFLIYTLCGSKYRESFLTLLKRTRCKHHTHVV